MAAAKIRLGLIIFFISSTVFAGQLYEWLDEKGVKHFSDLPQGAENGGYQLPKNDLGSDDAEQKKEERKYKDIYKEMIGGPREEG